MRRKRREIILTPPSGGKTLRLWAPCAAQARSESPAELRQDFALEPGVLLHPEPVARARGGQGEEFGQVFVARTHGFGEGFFPPRAEVVGVTVAADEQRETDGGQVRARCRGPVRRAFGPGRGPPRRPP